ncbi:MAG: hypothetical protein KDA65_04625, partial [Planctomycetaceae bacterium]|nr:hypothetical protein [Planctomycetaceae bacterium]
MQKIQRFAQPFFGRRINSKRRIQNKTRIELAAIDHLESRVLLSSTNPTGISEDGSDIAKSPFLEFETNWAVSFGGASDDEGDRILTDLSGSVFVHGTYEGLVDFAPGTAEYFLDSGSEPGIFLAMYNSDGILNWAHHLGASDDIRPTEITLDGSGNVLLTGWFYNTVDFDPGPGENNLTSRRFDDCFIAKYDREGNHLWAKSFRGQSANKGYVVRSDSEDNVYIGGRFHSRNDVDPGPNVLELSSKGESDMLLVKLDANGDLVWGNSFGSYYDDRIYHLEVDGDGNIFIAGHFALTVDFDPSEEVYNLSSSNNSSEIFLAKYDTDGNFVWVRSFSGPGDNDSEGVKLDAEGNIYLVGYFEGTVDFDPGEGTHFLTSVGDYDCFVAKLDSEGNLIWVNQAGGPGRDENGSVELDSEGNVYVHGFFSGIADFNPGLAEYFLETENEESRHIWVMDNDGQFLYATRVIDDDKARVGSTSLYKDSQFLTTGSFVDGADFDSGPDVVNLTNNGGTDAFIATFDHPQYLAVDLNTNRILGITGATVTNSGAFRTQAETTVTFTTDKGTVTSYGNGEFSWTYTPTYEDRGIHKVTITATGSNGVETTV